MPFPSRKSVQAGKDSQEASDKSTANGSGGVDLSTLPGDEPRSVIHIKANRVSYGPNIESAEILGRLNATLKRPAYTIGVVLGGIALSVGLGFLEPLLFLPTFGVSLVFAALTNQSDRKRRTYTLQYHFDDAALRRWTALEEAFTALAESQALWQAVPLDPAYDWKQTPGSSTLVNRARVTLAAQPAASILSTVTPYCLRLGSRELYFFPDRLYVYQEESYQAIDYDALRITTGQTLFMEEESVPSDASTVGSTWKHDNPNSGPDQRFENHRKLPVAGYGVVEFQAATGFKLLLYVSSRQAAQQFGTLYPQSRPRASQAASQQQARKQQSPPRPPQPEFASPLEPPLPPCYETLDLPLDCTQAEATAQYRRLAIAYHPDRVSARPEAFKTMAHQKMAEVNTAFAELKRLRGW